MKNPPAWLTCPLDQRSLCQKTGRTQFVRTYVVGRIVNPSYASDSVSVSGDGLQPKRKTSAGGWDHPAEGGYEDLAKSEIQILDLLFCFDWDGGVSLFLVFLQVSVLDDVGIAVALGGQIERVGRITGPHAHSFGFLGGDFDSAGVADAGAFGGHHGPLDGRRVPFHFLDFGDLRLDMSGRGDGHRAFGIFRSLGRFHGSAVGAIPTNHFLAAVVRAM